MKICPMRFAKEYTTDPFCNMDCAWFIPPVTEDKEGGCAINILAIASLLQNTFTVELVKDSIKSDQKK